MPMDPDAEKLPSKTALDSYIVTLSNSAQNSDRAGEGAAAEAAFSVFAAFINGM
ncbi:MAG TPA: hypothetical protein VN577_14805 [Terriglobales bacterium]|nr:hypothetical protein [Terriglobales bacterium]